MGLGFQSQKMKYLDSLINTLLRLKLLRHNIFSFNFNENKDSFIKFGDLVNEKINSNEIILFTDIMNQINPSIWRI